ncbi:pentapeptide repeat-containing protein [cyanobacterium endosymbiont of Epithemia turgida]|uniref:pentapeptide repeat-containing protein n=1 Tax=cyanobacterium endosymbiont of Epithemia turgida TaxID=718217 RepID=UPI0011AE7C20
MINHKLQLQKNCIKVNLRRVDLNKTNLKQCNLSKFTLKVASLDKKFFTEVSAI